MKRHLVCAKRISVSRLAAITLVLGIVMSVRLPAQVVGGMILGTIADPFGAVIPKAQVSIKNLATGTTRATVTDAAGFYAAPNLLPGAYEVTVSASGFGTEVQTGITLTVGSQQ